MLGHVCLFSFIFLRPLRVASFSIRDSKFSCKRCHRHRLPIFPRHFLLSWTICRFVAFDTPFRDARYAVSSPLIRRFVNSELPPPFLIQPSVTNVTKDRAFFAWSEWGIWHFKNSDSFHTMRILSVGNEGKHRKMKEYCVKSIISNVKYYIKYIIIS